MRGPALVVGTIQTVSGRVCSKSLTLVCDRSENRSAVVPQTATEPRSGASLWFGSPANLSESFIVGRGAFTLTNELYLRPRKRMRPVKARPLYTL
jgi:hypothetical protein